MKKILFITILALCLPFLANAQPAENIFEARVLKILEERVRISDDGKEFKQQNLRLEGIEGEWKGKQFNFQGISEFEVISSNIYKPGDKVIIDFAQDADGNYIFFILDYVRRGPLLFLAGLFALAIILIGKWKGLRSLLSLGVSFAIIMYFIIPQILAGQNPLFIGILGSLAILLFLIYITEGFNKKSHLAVLSISISLLLTGGLAFLFSYFSRLTGTAQEDVMYLMGIGKGMVDFRGLLLVGILIGALGVLDDMVISQIEAVVQIKNANPKIKDKELLKKSFEIGRSHLGAIINTLFLAYVAVSLPFLLLFSAGSTATFSQVINNELIATEIIRTLVGSIGIALALPISTIIAVQYYAKTKKK